MSHDPWAPSPAFLEWLDSLPPTPRHAARLAQQAEVARKAEAAAQHAAIILERQRIAAAKVAEKVESSRANKRGRQKRQQAMYPNSRVHLMEDDDKWGK